LTGSLRILFITPYLGSPAYSGAQRRLEGLMRGLASRHHVSVVSFVEPVDDAASCSIRATRRYCGEVTVVPNHRYALTTRQKRLLQLRSLVSSRSFESFVYRSPALRYAIAGLLESGSYDVVNFEFMHMAVNLPETGGKQRRNTILVLDEHNIEYDLVRRMAGSGAGLDRTLYSVVDSRKLRREEREAWRRFDGCTTTSERDEDIVRREMPGLRTAVVPNAVDVEFFRTSRANNVEEPRTVLFFGRLDYHPNLDGLRFFLNDIFPRLRARHPDVRLRIVGLSIPEIAARAGAGVEVVGLVDDIRPHLDRASVVVAPLRIGGGTRFKILEAMAMEKAVVSTSVGAEGIDARDGTEILVADAPDCFAAHVGRLFESEALRRRMGQAARSLIARRYSWDHSVDRLEQFYDQLLEHNRSGS
jgi:glycosyltransferase involved in cell wall biosynthesis